MDNNVVENMPISQNERVKIWQSLNQLNVKLDKVLYAQGRIAETLGALVDNHVGKVKKDEPVRKNLPREELFVLLKKLMKPGRHYHHTAIKHLILDSGYKGPLPNHRMAICSAMTLLAQDGLLMRIGKGPYMLPDEVSTNA